MDTRDNSDTGVTGPESSAAMVARLAAIVASSNDAIISKSLAGIITSWNPAAERIFGYSARETIGHSMLMLFPEERRGEETEILPASNAENKLTILKRFASARMAGELMCL